MPRARTPRPGVVLRPDGPAESSLGLVPAALGALVALVVGLPLMLWLRPQGLLHAPPLLLTGMLVVLALAAADPVQRWIGSGRVDNRPTLRIVLAFTLFAAPAWLAGWSFLLPVAAVLVSVVHVERSGSRVWRSAALVAAVFTVVGQLALHLSWIPTVVPRSVSHLTAAAALALACLGVAYVGMSVGNRERSEHALARTEARARALMDSSNDVLTVSDAGGVLTYVSPAVERSMGYSATTLLGTPLLDLVDSDYVEQVRRRLAHVVALGDGARTSMDVLVVLASHERRWYEWTVHNLLGDPLVEGLVVDQRDVTERLLHSEALAHAAAHDDLTGLSNRRELMRRLGSTLVQASPGGAVAVLFIDLDGFKAVNDTFGHAAGDDLLVVVARRLRASLRPHDHLARLGGDEFCAVLTEIRDAAEVGVVVERLETELSRPVALAGRRVSVHASVGVAMTSEGSTDPETLFAHADAAMYQVKYARKQPAGHVPSARERSGPAAGQGPAER